ncbi:YheC/YheD family protein [Caldalkalibacillus salinus]|uniref:YheC/YheD family endospore coat-associated protein n=1 Tax=Caldalkalibacillus salinus TaxID=2803787 RepID=UPI001921CDF0|nr:YheC/YheD family protein [Caldalkalibacillus salinus]
MEPKIVTVKQHPSSNNKVFLCPEIASSFEKNAFITIHYGLEKTKATIVPVKDKGVVAFSSNVWQKLNIPFPHKMHVQAKDKRLLIGPLVGIMTTGVRPHRTHPVGQRTGFYTKYILTQKNIPASFFIFSPADIISDDRVVGYFLRKQDGKLFWSRHVVPYPTAVYNRIFRQGEKMRFVHKGKRRLEQKGSKVFNPSTFNKWEIHQLIHERADVKQYVPESVINPDLTTLKYLLQKYKMVYLKPAEGYLGLGIVQLIQQPKGVICRFNKQGRNHTRLYPSLQSLIKGMFKGKSLRKYIAQQGIRLIHYEGRTIDFRVHANKDVHGQWKMTGAAAKMSGKGSVTTHMRTGGNVLSFDTVIRSFFSNKQYEKVYENMKEAVILLANAIEESVSGYVGDIGFDIGIDQQGRPWMFEANSQPGRHVFAHPSMRESELLTRKGILEYALYLSGFGFTQKEVISS